MCFACRIAMLNGQRSGIMNTKMTTVQVLNLSFHGIGRPLGRDFGEEERDYWASRGTFEAVLDAVAGRGDVRLSFDDGNSSDVDVVLPALLERELKASFFLVPAWLGTPGFMTRADVRALVRDGMTIGNHGLRHQIWTELPPDRLEHEVNQGRQLLEELTGTNLTTLAIPYGRYDDAVLDMLRADAYTRIFTSDGGSADPDAWLQPREHVRSGHDRAAIAALLSRLDGVPPAS